MKKTLWMIIGSLLFLSGCGGPSYEPVAINEGVDTCAVCNMMIADDAFATQLILKDGKVVKFDDIGDLYVWKKQNGSERIGMGFVRDYNTMEWIPLQDAYYVYDREFKTPMAYGMYAFKDAESAQKLMEHENKGQLLTADELENHHWERNMDMVEQMKEMHGHGSEEGHGHGMAGAGAQH